MAAFDRIRSGIPAMDTALDSIRLGDNVVWEVDTLDSFRCFMQPYVTQALADGRNLNYIRFAAHKPLLQPQPGLKIHEVPLTHQFEAFTVAIHNIIEQEGRDAFYVFDCLSELQTAWATDLMMGNFFHLTCPFLFVLDTVAFFPVIRGKHSFEAIDKIRDTTQLYLSVYAGGNGCYVRPQKVWERSSPTMFQPHFYDRENGSFEVLTDGIHLSRFYQALNLSDLENEDQNIDHWVRFFRGALQKWRQGQDITAECGRICDIMLTRDERMRELIKQNFTPEDYFSVRSRMVGTGIIGGKACGMLLARKLTENLRPDIFSRLEPHDSHYIGADVYYAYIVDNGFFDLYIRQRTGGEYFSLADELQERMMSGTFSPAIEEQFRHLLDYYGTDPVIVRSSSMLEDSFGNAFAGKYESVFCINRGTREERLQEFENAVRVVYASTMSLSALDYRLRRGLEKQDEQMALLVQRVSGSHYPGFFMPCAAGVGYSASPYRRGGDRNDDRGMLRLVMGLGTGAVDRNSASYPKIVPLDAPGRAVSGTDEEKHRYAQRRIDVLCAEGNVLQGVPMETVEKELPPYLKGMLLSHDYPAEAVFRAQGTDRDIRYISCEGIIRNNALMADLRDMLALLQQAYDYPVDTEFTINLARNGEYMINLLQCRPLQVSRTGERVDLPTQPDPARILLQADGSSMGFSRRLLPDYIVRIDPAAYYNTEYRLKGAVARTLGQLNWAFRGKDQCLMLLTPGRICTSSPELGVPSSFADISEFSMICEVAVSGIGYNPELSYGSHIFQDLVETEILYSAVFDNGRTARYAPQLLAGCRNCLTDFVPDADAHMRSVIQVAKVRGRCSVYYDMPSDRLLCLLT